jgi:hypothetical protein
MRFCCISVKLDGNIARPRGIAAEVSCYLWLYCLSSCLLHRGKRTVWSSLPEKGCLIDVVCIVALVGAKLIMQSFKLPIEVGNVNQSSFTIEIMLPNTVALLESSKPSVWQLLHGVVIELYSLSLEFHNCCLYYVAWNGICFSSLHSYQANSATSRPGQRTGVCRFVSELASSPSMYVKHSAFRLSEIVDSARVRAYCSRNHYWHCFFDAFPLQVTLW